MPAAARKIALTDRSLKALKPAPKGTRPVVWDALIPNLGVRSTDKGTHSFVVAKRRPGDRNPKWVTLGEHPAMTLANARARARQVLGELAEGHDPATLAEARRRATDEAERQQRASTFAAVAEDFIRRHAMTRRSGRATAGLIRRELVPAWGDRPLADIARRDVIKLVDAILDRGGPAAAPGSRRKAGGPYAARHALAAARKLFNWAVGRDILAASPCDRVKTAELLGAAVHRDRVLTDHEIRRVWAAAGVTPYPYGPLVRVLMLTGQRRDEIAGASWGEIDLERGLLTIPPERTKVDDAHVVPLTTTTVALLEGLPRFAAGDFVFAGQTGAKPFSGFSKAKKRLNRAIGEIAPFTLHDLRRTARTRMAELGVTPFVGELVIGHRQKGVHAVYDLHTYDDEKRAALLKWEAKLLSIVAPEPAVPNVVPMPARARG